MDITEKIDLMLSGVFSAPTRTRVSRAARKKADPKNEKGEGVHEPEAIHTVASKVYR